MSLKGLIEIAIIGAIIAIGIILAPLIAFLSFKFHVIGIVQLMYERQSLSPAIPELLQTGAAFEIKEVINPRYTQTIDIYEAIACKNLPSFDRMVGEDKLEGTLLNFLRQLPGENCFNLTIDEEEIVEVWCGKKMEKDVSSGPIFLPFGKKLIGMLELKTEEVEK